MIVRRGTALAVQGLAETGCVSGHGRPKIGYVTERNRLIGNSCAKGRPLHQSSIGDRVLKRCSKEPDFQPVIHAEAAAANIGGDPDGHLFFDKCSDDR